MTLYFLTEIAYICRTKPMIDLLIVGIYISVGIGYVVYKAIKR